jgi:hypothetical protein
MYKIVQVCLIYASSNIDVPVNLLWSIYNGILSAALLDHDSTAHKQH